MTAPAKLIARSLLAWLLLLMASISFAETLLESAQSYFDRAEYKSAMIQLKNLVRDKPKHIEARVLLGKTQFMLSDYPSAEKELERALQLGAVKDDVLADLAKSYLRQGKFEKVLEQVSVDAVTMDSVRGELYALRGTAYLGQDQTEPAKEAFERSLAFERSNLALLGLARIALNEKDFSQAESLAQEVVSSGGDQPNAYLILGRLKAAQQQQLDQAIGHYSDGLALDQGHIDLRLSRADAYLAVANTASARVDIEFILDNYAAFPEALYLMARIQYEEGAYAKAQESAEAVLNLDRHHIRTLYVLGASYYAQNFFNQAKTTLGRFLEEEPNQPAAIRMLASIDLLQQQPKSTIARLTPLVDARVNDAWVYSLMGQAYTLLGEAEAALGMLKKAVVIDPSNSQYRTQLAIYQLLSGDEGAAIRDMENVVKQEGAGGQSELLLIITYIQTQQFEDALELIKQRESLSPKNPIYPHLKGILYKQKGELASAVQAFEQALLIDPHHSLTLLALAAQALHEKQPDKAETLYLRILEGKGAPLDAQLALARIAWQKGDKKAALEWLDQAHKQRPELFEPVSLMTEYYLLEDEPLKALRIISQYQRAYLENPSALSLLASVQIQNQNYEKAAAPLLRLIELNQATAEHRYLLAGIYFRRENFQQSMTVLDENIGLYPGHEPSWLLKNSLFIAKGEFTSAQAHIDRFKQMQPESALVEHLAGDLFFAQGQWEQAAQAYEKAIARSPSSQRVLSLAAALIRKGAAGEAIEALKRQLAQAPDDLPVRTQLGTLYEMAGKQQLAADEYLRVIERQPDSLVALNNLAGLLMEKAPQQAVEYAEKAHQIAPEREDISDTLGWIYLHTGQAKKGLELLQKANRKNPNDLIIRYHLAVALKNNGRESDARFQLKMVLDNPRAKQLAEYEAAHRLYAALK
mgnify:CR=1 FL=1|tara:strand:- start:1829 stop:4603 length:2775 start_codon:yes stop_codon:yes gene_type:complete